MIHPDGDTLLKFVLQTLDESENAAVREHVSACEQCREQEWKLEGEVKRLASIDFRVDMVAPPRLPRRSRLFSTVLRSAAVLAVGFVVGYATAELSNPVHPIPLQQRLIPAEIAVPHSGYIPCQEVDMKIPRPM